MTKRPHRSTLHVIPPTASELVEILDDMFPPRCIKPGETMEDAQRYAGKRELGEEKEGCLCFYVILSIATLLLLP